MKRLYLLLFLSLGIITTASAKSDSKKKKNEVAHVKGNYSKQIVFGKRVKEVFLEGCNVQCDTSYALIFKAKNVKLHVVDGTKNILGDAGIKTNRNLLIDGNGTVTVDAKKDGHKGIVVGGSLTVNDNPVISVTTSGNPIKQIKVDTPMPGGQMPDFNDSTFKAKMDSLMAKGGMPGFGGGPMSQSPGGMMPQSPNGQMPQGPNGQIPQGPGGQMPNFMKGPNGERDTTNAMGGNPMGGYVRYTYEGATKAIKVMGSVTINGGEITINTSTPGAEGLEAKDTLTVNGGKLHVEAHNDGLSIGKLMVVNGGDIYVYSLTNDAIDINGGEASPFAGKGEGVSGMTPPHFGPDMPDFDPSNMQNFDPAEMQKKMQEAMAKMPPRYIQTGGNVTCKTDAGMPEEALDIDMSKIVKTGGTLTRIPEEHGFGPFGGAPIQNEGKK